MKSRSYVLLLMGLTLSGLSNLLIAGSRMVVVNECDYPKDWNQFLPGSTYIEGGQGSMAGVKPIIQHKYLFEEYIFFRKNWDFSRKGIKADEGASFVADAIGRQLSCETVVLTRDSLRSFCRRFGQCDELPTDTLERSRIYTLLCEYYEANYLLLLRESIWSVELQTKKTGSRPRRISGWLELECENQWAIYNRAAGTIEKTFAVSGHGSDQKIDVLQAQCDSIAKLRHIVDTRFATFEKPVVVSALLKASDASAVEVKEYLFPLLN